MAAARILSVWSAAILADVSRGRGTLIAGRHTVRVLEARFHPERRSNPHHLVVGHLLWESGRPTGEPVLRYAGTADTHPMISKLQYLLTVTKPDCFQRLQALRSEFWSFVEVHGWAAGRWASRR